MVSKVLGNLEMPIKYCEIMSKAVVHAVLLYGINILVVTDAIMTVLESFHQSIARRIVGMMLRRCNGGNGG